MPEKVEHFVTGTPGFTTKLNEFVDAFNALAEEVEKKADKRVAKTAATTK